MKKPYAQCSVCWRVGQAKRGKRVRLAICLCICLLAMVPYAFAGKEFAPVGGPGGSAFREVCPLGQYVVGVRYRYGDWIDQISIICASVDANGMTGQNWYGAAFGGNGGVGPYERFCNPGYIISGASILLRNHPSRYVKMMDMYCRSTTSNNGHKLMNVGAPSSYFGDSDQYCPDGEAVIGIQGRYGAFVDAIGMICGAFAQRTPSSPKPISEACLNLKGDPVPAQWKDMLDVHNEKRAEHCVAPLKWSNELAQAAQAYAEKCMIGQHGSDGENIASAWFEGPTGPVTPAMSDKDIFFSKWYCEVNNYDHNNPEFKSGTTTNDCKNVNAHFTQIVWKDTCQIGCGRADCDIRGEDGKIHKGTQWVCRYYPPGNVNATDPAVLTQQVSPALCK